MVEFRADNKKIAKNTLIMYLRMLFMMFVSLYTSRIVFNALGVSDYGIYNIVGGIIVFLSFINSALSRATTRYITAELTNDNKESQSNVFNLAVIAHIIIAIIILILSESIGVLILNHCLNIPEDRIFAANIVYQFSVLSSLFSVMQTPFTAVIIAHERMSIFAYFSIIEAIMKLLTAFILTTYANDKLILYAIMIFIVGIINILIIRTYCYNKFLMCKWKKPHNGKLFKEMFGFMGWNLTGQASVVATNQGVNFLVNVFHGVVVNAAIGISNSIANILNQIVTNFQIAFNPEIIKLYVSGQHTEVIKLAIRCTKISSFLILLFIVPITFQIENILFVWLGNYPEYAAEFCILTLIGIYFDNVSAPMWMIRSADKKIKNYQIVISSIYSLCFWGGWLILFLGVVPYAIIWVRIFVYFVMLIIRAFYVKSLIPELNVSLYIYELFGCTTKVVIIPLVSLYILSQYDFGGHFLNLSINVTVGLLLMCICTYLLGLTTEERNLIQKKLLNRIK